MSPNDPHLVLQRIISANQAHVKRPAKARTTQAYRQSITVPSRARYRPRLQVNHTAEVAAVARRLPTPAARKAAKHWVWAIYDSPKAKAARQRRKGQTQ